ncbi:MAG TPA: hypothetical protein VIF62_22280 [Labilithrix sp.]
MIAIATATAAPALADAPSDPAGAQTLFYEARNLMKQGKFAEACPKLAESLRLDEGMGTRFNLADCEEHVGHIATAWAGFLEVAGKARAAKQPDREKIARQRAQALEPRLPKLVIDVEPNAPAGLEVKRDGVTVGSAAWGTPIPVDPGQHTIVADAPGRIQFETRVQSTEAKTSHVTITLAAAPVAPPAVATPAPAPPSPEPQPTQLTYAEAPGPNQALRDAFPPPEQDDRGKAQRIVGWTAGGLGLASLAVSGAFGIVSLDKHNSSRSHCAGDVCDATGASLREDAIRAGNVATGAAIGGGAGVVLGAILLLTAPSAPSSKAIQAVPSVAQGYGGLTIQGRLP